MTTPPVFARLAAAHGTAAVVTDPHEIANVRGAEGLEAFLASAADLPVEIHVMLPSCVPATHLETAGATPRRPRPRRPSTGGRTSSASPR